MILRDLMVRTGMRASQSMECLSKILRLKRSGTRQLELVSLEDRLLFSAAPGPAPEAPADNAQIESVIMASLEAPVEILSDGTAEESDATNAQGLQPLGLDVDTSTANSSSSIREQPTTRTCSMTCGRTRTLTVRSMWCC